MCTFDGDVQRAFNTLNRDLARHLVRWKRLTGKKHKATAFSWEKTDRAEALRKAAGIKG